MADILFLLLIILVLIVLVVHLYLEGAKHNRGLRRYEGLASKEAAERELDSRIQMRQTELNHLLSGQEQLNTQIKHLQQKLSKLSEEDYLQSLGFYEPKYDFVKSEDFKYRFDQIVDERKKLIKSKKAAVCYKNWAVGEDEKKGRDLVKNYLRLIIGTFDITCDTAISDAKTKNVNRLKNKIVDTFEKLNKWSEILECEITGEYLDLRLKELDLKYELELKKQEEGERDRLLREQRSQAMKEEKEQKEAEELNQEIEMVQQRERMHQQELDRIRRETAEAEGEKRKKLELRIKQLEQQVAQDKSDEEDAISRSRRRKRGYIYVISSIGSFREDNV